MAHKPSFLAVLESFGLNPESMSYFLHATQGRIIGGSAASAFFGTPLEDIQDIDIWIPLPVQPGGKELYDVADWNVSTYIELLRNNVYNFFERNQKPPTKNTLLSKSLDYITHKYRGVYQRLTTTNVDNHIQIALSNIVLSVETWKNPWTERTIKVIYTYNIGILDILSSFDMDVCQFYVEGYDTQFIVKHNHSPKTLATLRNGTATVFSQYDSQLTDYQQKRLNERIAKYKKLGYTVKSETTGYPWIGNNLPPAPNESFWQDFEFTTDEVKNYTDKDSLRQKFYEMLVEAGCDFVGSDTKGNLDILVNLHFKWTIDHINNEDNWHYIWRFTWDADRKEENIYLRHMSLLNPY